MPSSFTSFFLNFQIGDGDARKGTRKPGIVVSNRGVMTGIKIGGSVFFFHRHRLILSYSIPEDF